MNEYQMALIGGVAIAAMWIVAYFLCWCCQWAWAWVDDEEVGNENLWVTFLAVKVWKLELRNSGADYPYYGSSWGSSDGIEAYCGSLIISALAPVFFVWCFNFYVVVLFVLSLIFLMQLTRFARRQKKLFDKHVTNKEIHTGE